MSLVPTNNSEIYLANSPIAGRLAYILDALLGMNGLGPNANSHSFHLSSAGSDNATNIAASATNVTGFDAGNIAAYWTYVKLYNKATAPTSADTPVRVFALPPGGGISKNNMQLPQFNLGLGIRIVKGQADNDNTAVLAGDVMIGGLDYNN